MRQIRKDFPVVGDPCHLLLADVFGFACPSLDGFSPVRLREVSAGMEEAIYL